MKLRPENIIYVILVVKIIIEKRRETNISIVDLKFNNENTKTDEGRRPTTVCGYRKNSFSGYIIIFYK